MIFFPLFFLFHFSILYKAIYELYRTIKYGALKKRPIFSSGSKNEHDDDDGDEDTQL